MKTPQEFCQKHNACKRGREFAYQFSTMEEVWEKCERADWLIWILERLDTSKETYVKIAITVAEGVLHLIPEGEEAPKNAVEAAKKWLEDPSEENRIAAAAAANTAAYAAADADSYAYAYDAYAAYAATDAANAANAAYATDAAVYAVYAATDAANAAYAAAYAVYAATDAARATARAAGACSTCDTIRSIVENPFK